MHFAARRDWMVAGFNQAAAWEAAVVSSVREATWPWLLALLMHDGLSDFDAYRGIVAAFHQRYPEDSLRRRLLSVSAANPIQALAREAAPISGLHPTQRRSDIVIHTVNLFTREFLPPPAKRAAQAADELFRLRAEGRHATRPAARIASYLILLTIHPFRDGNGRTARVLFAADTAASGDPASALLALPWLHGHRNARFHLAAKCARAGDFGMLFDLYFESGHAALQALQHPLALLDAALVSGDASAIEAAARTLHAAVSLHVRQG